MSIHGIEVQARREALGLSQSALAELLGVTRMTVSRWESGERAVGSNVADELAALEDRVEELTVRMISAATVTAEAGHAPALLVHRGQIASGQVHDTHGPALPAVLQRVAAAHARIELEGDGVDVPILPAN